MVRPVDSAPVLMATLLRSLARVNTAPAMAELFRSMIMSTPSASHHWRALVPPMSALFWWSANTSSMGLPCTLPPKSSIAILAASTEPLPPESAYWPDMSVSTPILTLSSEMPAACAARLAQASMAATAVVVRWVMAVCLQNGCCMRKRCATGAVGHRMACRADSGWIIKTRRRALHRASP
ncbi:hypothetical protein D3C72_1592080 [compost metagenome]